MLKEKFILEAYKAFDQAGHTSSWSKNIHDNFYGNFMKTHEEITEIIGGEARIYEVETTGKIGIDHSQIPSLLDTIRYTFEDYRLDYFKRYGLQLANLHEPMIQVNGKPFKTTKHLNVFINHCLDKALIPEGVAESLKENVQKLGEQYEKFCGTEKNTYSVKISLDIMDFVKLGSFGVDGSSCFKIGAVGSCYKYNFGQLYNSFILFISDANGIVARSLGWINTKDNCVNFFNLYMGKSVRGDHLLTGVYKTNLSNIIEVLSEISQDLLKSDDIQMSENKIIRDARSMPKYFYMNTYPIWTFHAKKTECPDQQMLNYMIDKVVHPDHR